MGPLFASRNATRNGGVPGEKRLDSGIMAKGRRFDPERPYQLEVEFQNDVLKVATLLQWKHYHTHNSQRSVAGFPDLVLVRGDKILFRELKTDSPKSQCTPAQKEWLELLERAGCDVGVWRPRDMDEIVRTLN